MAPVVRLRTINHPFRPIRVFTRELVPSLFEDQYPKVDRNRFSHSSDTAL